jgi:hypothetical protein
MEIVLNFLENNWIWFLAFFVLFIAVNISAFSFNVELYFITMFLSWAIFFIWLGSLF